MSNHINFVLNNSAKKMILIGHSFDGWIAQWVAIRAPERVSKLILMGTGTGKLTPDLHNIFEEMSSYFKNNKRIEFFEKLRYTIVHEDRKSDNDLLNLVKLMLIDFSYEGLLNQVITDLEGKETTAFLSILNAHLINTWQTRSIL